MNNTNNSPTENFPPVMEYLPDIINYRFLLNYSTPVLHFILQFIVTLFISLKEVS